MKHAVRLLMLALFVSACATFSPVTPANHGLYPELTGIPVYPGSLGWSQGIPGVNQESETSQTFSYIAKVSKHRTLLEFYEEKMADEGWEVLEKSEDLKTNNAELMFARSKTVAHIQMIPWTANSYLVYVVLYEDPVLEE
jgi:hypothetical protein